MQAAIQYQRARVVSLIFIGVRLQHPDGHSQRKLKRTPTIARVSAATSYFEEVRTTFNLQHLCLSLRWPKSTI